MTAGSVDQRAVESLRFKYPDMSDDQIRQTLTFSFVCIHLAAADLVGSLMRSWQRRG